ncbi:hypothetical protein LTR50_001504 [Elasticomyces elasticus]|nr:hypothetical protein LTR50_001504 [Elasticomyces elasticus]
MADSKRNSTAGRIATPKAGAQPMQDAHEALGKAIGARIKLTTMAPHAQTLTGTLYTACPITNLLALNTAPAPPNPSSSTAKQPGDYHIIPVTKVQSFQVLSGASETADPRPGSGLGIVDVKRLKAREQTRVTRAQEEEMEKGRGVSAEAQAIFDAFKRLYSKGVRWHEAQIVVDNAVIISAPYRPEDCKAPKDKQEALNRVKKILEGEKRKIAEKVKVVTPAERRKGG